jgi:hypothetical protein
LTDSPSINNGAQGPALGAVPWQGWRNHGKTGHLPKRYAETVGHMPFVASIAITPIAKG